MLNLYVKAKNMMAREEGQGMVEYALIVGLMVAAIIAAIAIFTPALDTIMTDLKAIVEGAL